MMTIFSSTPVQDKLATYNSILDELSQAKLLARRNNCCQRVLDAIENTTAIVFYEMKKLEATYAAFNTEYPVND